VRLTDLIREFNIDGTPWTVAIGDVVWLFNENQLDAMPHVATVTAFGEDNMVDLTYNAVVGSRLVPVQGVCLVGDERLSNVNYRKRGSWIPRGAFPSLNLK
jgi:hypothetical protein